MCLFDFILFSKWPVMTYYCTGGLVSTKLDWPISSMKKCILIMWCVCFLSMSTRQLNINKLLLLFLILIADCVDPQTVNGCMWSVSGGMKAIVDGLSSGSGGGRMIWRSGRLVNGWMEDERIYGRQIKRMDGYISQCSYMTIKVCIVSAGLILFTTKKHMCLIVEQ